MLRPAALILAAAALAAWAAPSPHNDWTTIPLAFHGANKSAPWTDEAVKQLAKYQMLTVEKWDQPCGGQHPKMNAPCDEEDIMLKSLLRVREQNPNLILLAYVNSVIDFSFYNLHKELKEMEANGTHVWMRDENGEVVVLDNDGSFYWDINRFDVTQPAMLQAWQKEIEYFTSQGINGIFADHGNKFLRPNKQGKYQLCDGTGSRFKCFNFTESFANKWNAAHTEQLAWVQGHVWPYPAIDSLNATWSVDACDFETHKQAVDQGKWVEARGYCSYTETCTAAFLTAAGDRSFAACFSSQDVNHTALPEWAKEWDYPLGAPKGPARKPEGSTVWTREFGSGTKVTYDEKSKKGTVAWASTEPVQRER